MVKTTGRRSKRGNQALKPLPRGVRLMFEPRLEKVESGLSSLGGARRVVKL